MVPCHTLHSPFPEAPSKPRKPKKKGCEIVPSAFRPHVLARDQNYGAGLLHFHQFCDSRKIPKSSRMPVSDNLLAPFVASWASKIATTTVENWLAGLHFWHNMHGVPWHRHALLHMSTAGVKKLVPESSKCPHRVPVMLEHMHMLYRNLDLSNTLDVSIFAVASITFWSCCRLGELITRKAPANGISWSSFSIPWSKTTLSAGAKIILSRVDDFTDPVSAFNHHISANALVPSHAPLFAFETASGGWAPMTRSWFLTRCNQVWKSAGLSELTGHCFRIGGATELLLRGVPPDVIAVQGHWKSRAFLEYWSKIDLILPLFVTLSFSDTHVAMIHSSMDSFNHRYK
ncbi:DNA breaking-rejoining enzyme [Suillus variegatus]|nr:DNA breaking-rejoining enzyme [Suillus variegatus]